MVRCNVAGVTFDGRQKMLKSLGRGSIQSAKLLSESPDNSYDPNAIRVIYSSKHIGYVPSSVAKSLAPAMDAGEHVRVANAEVGKFQGVWYVALAIEGEADLYDPY